jgi:GNAT superfamily N-acetyltransferase
MADEVEDGAPGARVRRVDDRLGLAILRVPLSGRTLVTYARDHVTVRTPSRPGLGIGNAIDLESPPHPDDLPRWVDRFRDTVGQLGVRRVHLRWEVATQQRPSAGPDLPAPLRAAAAGLGFEVVPTAVLLLDSLAPGVDGAAEVSPVEAPSAVPGGPVDRRWHAATVLYRYTADEPGADGWRDWDEDAVAFSVEVQRELAADGRARVWLAARHGAPVGRLTLVHDRQGLGAVDDVVVHPVHRGAGVAGGLVHRAVADHLAADPDARIGLGVVPGSPAERLALRLGFRHHAVVWSARTAG